MGLTNKARRNAKAARTARARHWISDKENQAEWNQKFKKILKADHEGTDSVISAILSNDQLSQLVATRIRMYVDADVALCLNEQTRADGIKYRNRLETDIAALRAARDMETERRNKGLALELGSLVDIYSHALEQCKQAFGTKRRGRDRDHSILCECKRFLESQLQHPVTNNALASLVNAGFDADGNSAKEPVTEEHIRKNLTHFKRRNPFWLK